MSVRQGIVFAVLFFVVAGVLTALSVAKDSCEGSGGAFVRGVWWYECVGGVR